MSWRAGGIRPWIVQRLSAVAMAIILCAFTLSVAMSAPENFQDWQDFIGGSIWNTAIILFWVSLFVHAWVGIRDVIMDYIHHDGLRFTILAFFAFFLISMTIWMLKIMILAVNL
ncbi:MAG: succinate dehydrogenase, hydrophobic membrane anchor protein [Gammaproteobacteria bacterium]|nr:succinate dehydrogenase, hydrophobic membrane anchor protein [Gammaproteobacteria bacterium]